MNKKQNHVASANQEKFSASGKTYSRNKTEVARKHPSDSQPLTAEEARQLQLEWMKRYHISIIHTGSNILIHISDSSNKSNTCEFLGIIPVKARLRKLMEVTMKYLCMIMYHEVIQVVQEGFARININLDI